MHLTGHVPCRNMFDKELIGKMKKGAFLVNTARGGICERDAIVEALESGQLGGEPPPQHDCADIMHKA